MSSVEISAKAIIRRMEYTDLDRVVEIESELFSDDWNEVMFQQEIVAHDAFVYEIAGKVIGYICGWLMYQEYNITNVAICKEFQGRGLGSVLLNFIMKRVNDLDCPEIFLEVRASNVAAIKLYEKSGFHLAGRRTKYYKNPEEDALLMVLSGEETDER